MSILRYISPTQLAISAELIALAIAEGQDSSELNTIGNYLVCLGGILLCIAAQQDFLEDVALKEKEAYESFMDSINKQTNNNSEEQQINELTEQEIKNQSVRNNDYNQRFYI